MKVGLYFGSFNPIHIGHIRVATFAQQRFNLDEVWLMVSPQNPFKDSKELAPEQDRLAMALIASKDTPFIRVSDFEFSMPRPSFTISSVRKLRTEYPENLFYLILGEDNLQSFHQWKDVNALLGLVEVIVYPRSSKAPVIPAELREFNHRFQVLSGDLIPVSATDIRHQLSTGFPPHGMLHPEVLNYIESHHLYSS